MNRRYYQSWYRLDQTDRYLIWFSNEIDGVVVEDDGNVPSFSDQEALGTYAKLHQLDLSSEQPRLQDLDAVVQWLRRPLAMAPDCHVLLAAWNLFGDLAVSTNEEFDSDPERTQKVYDKLFWGNNLPSVTPPGKHYIPEWEDDELLLMQEILSEGLLLFRKCVKFHS